MYTLFSFVGGMIFVWLLLTIAFVVGELVSVGLTSIWFAAGSFAAMLAAVCGANIAVQIFLFLAVAVGLLIGTRPWAQRFINSRTQRTNADRAIGQVIRITERVSNINQSGKAVVTGQEWTVRSRYDNEVIEEGEFARVLEISGVKLIVEKCRQEA